MASNNLSVALNITLDEVMRGYFMTRRRSLLTELDDLEKLLGISPRTTELRKAQKQPVYNVEMEYRKEGE